MLQFSLAALHYPLPKESLLSTVRDDTDFEFGRSCGDAVWTLAYALNKSIEGILHKFNILGRFRSETYYMHTDRQSRLVWQ